MKPTFQKLTCTALIGVGLATMALLAKPLAGHQALDFPVNPLGVNRSPYGEILAMAMQGPIDTFWHQGELAKAAPNVAGSTGCNVCGEDHGCGHSPRKPKAEGRPARPQPWNQRLRVFLENLDDASTARTNPVRGSGALDLHIRRQVENKLRFAYRLDPAHYGNYNSYHFFLTEPQVGTQPVLTPEAARLARETIEYCLAEEHDPRPSLTAAAAATNMLHLMFADRRTGGQLFDAAQMRESLNLLDHCLARHLAIHETWTAAGHHELLSPMRITEMEDRFTFIRRIRDAAEPAVIRYEQEETTRSPDSENN